MVQAAKTANRRNKKAGLAKSRIRLFYPDQGKTSALTVPAAEFIDTASRIENFLLTRIKRMARRAYFDAQVVPYGRTRLEDVAATTGHVNLLVVGMYIWFH